MALATSSEGGYRITYLLHVQVGINMKALKFVEMNLSNKLLSLKE